MIFYNLEITRLLCKHTSLTTKEEKLIDRNKRYYTLIVRYDPQINCDCRLDFFMTTIVRASLMSSSGVQKDIVKRKPRSTKDFQLSERETKLIDNLCGATVASSALVSDSDGSPACFFYFPELYIRSSNIFV